MLTASHDYELQPVIFVLDVIDECKESDRRDLILKLTETCAKNRKRHSKIKFLLTSRPYMDIMFRFKALLDLFSKIYIPGEEASDQISEEVNCVIRHRIQKLAHDMDLENDFREYLERRLLSIRHRTYLWVYLIFDELNSHVFKKTKKGLEKAIETLPESVNQAYEKILARSKDTQMVLKTLNVILAARRPLKLMEVNIAVNFDANARSIEELDLEEEHHFKRTLREWCGLFVAIDGDRVHLLHQTGREFLLNRPSYPEFGPDRPLRWQGSMDIRRAHSYLADVSLQLLNLRDPNGATGRLLFSPESDGTYGFREYCAIYWAKHFREASPEDRVKMVPKALQVCEPGSKCLRSWFPLYERTDTIGFNTERRDAAFAILSLLRIDEAVESLLPDGNIQPNNRDQTALHLIA